MIKYFVIRNFRGRLHAHCSSVKMLKGYMLMRWNAKGYMGNKRLGIPGIEYTTCI